MNLQEIQMNTQRVRAFTLVELIVVITILVILGTIAFLNLGTFSASARDSQRTSDLNQINTQVMTAQTRNGTAYSSMVVSNTTVQLTTPSIGGASWALNTSYFAGDVNYSLLAVDPVKMDDPIASKPYKMASTTLAGTAYELAASLESYNGTPAALVMGTFRSRDLSATNTASGTISGTTLTLTSGLGILRSNDTIKGTTGTGVITAISSDMTKITFSGAITGTGNVFTLNAAETAGLMGSGANVITNKGTVLPY